MAAENRNNRNKNKNRIQSEDTAEDTSRGYSSISTAL